MSTRHTRNTIQIYLHLLPVRFHLRIVLPPAFSRFNSVNSRSVSLAVYLASLLSFVRSGGVSFGSVLFYLTLLHISICNYLYYHSLSLSFFASIVSLSLITLFILFVFFLFLSHFGLHIASILCMCMSKLLPLLAEIPSKLVSNLQAIAYFICHYFTLLLF